MWVCAVAISLADRLWRRRCVCLCVQDAVELTRGACSMAAALPLYSVPLLVYLILYYPYVPPQSIQPL